MKPGITLLPGEWYGWQMLPGYIGDHCVPYFSPIRVENAVPKKTGKAILVVRFFNALYAQGVQDFNLELQVLKRLDGYLVAQPVSSSNAELERTVVISVLESEWIRLFCPSVWQALNSATDYSFHSGNLQSALDNLFRFPRSKR